MNREELINAVKVKLEEFSPFEQIEDSGLEVINQTEFEENAVRPIRAYIDRQLDEAARDILNIIPVTLIHANGNNVKAIDTTEIEVIDKVGYISLDNHSDFIKIYTVRLPNWYRSIHESITPATDPILYEQQGNPFLRGKVVNPVVAIANGKIELYSVTTETIEATKTIINYVCSTAAEDVQEDLQQLVVMNCAIKLSEIYGRTESAKALSEELANMLAGEIKAISRTKIETTK